MKHGSILSLDTQASEPRRRRRADLMEGEEVAPEFSQHRELVGTVADSISITLRSLGSAIEDFHSVILTSLGMNMVIEEH